jgi:F-type H+-transporting ATPase subunit delta
MVTGRQARRDARRLFRRCLVDGRLNRARASTIAHQIARGGRRGRLELLLEFLRLVRMDRDRRTVIVEGAVMPDDEVRDAVRSRLERMYGSALDIVGVERPALLGGLRITVGSDVYDGSVQARLASIEARLQGAHAGRGSHG